RGSSPTRWRARICPLDAVAMMIPHLRLCCLRVVGVHMATPGLVSVTPVIRTAWTLLHERSNLAALGPYREERSMQKVNRRSAVALGLAAAATAMVKPAAAQTTDYKDATPWPGVVVRVYSGERPSIIPGFEPVSMHDIVMQPGSQTIGHQIRHACV